MFTNIIFFILALLIYHTRSLGPRLPLIDLWVNAGLLLLFLVVFGLETWRRFHRLHFLALDNRQGKYTLQRSFQQITQYLMILSLIFFAAEIYLINFKSLVTLIPGTGRFSSLEGALGISLYLLHLVLIWVLGYPAQETLFRSYQGRGPYLRSQLQFNLPILFPWFFITFLSDLIGLISAPWLRTFLNQPLGEMIYVLTFLLLLAVFFPFMIKTWWQCRPLPDGPKKEILEEFCREMGSPFHQVFLWPAFGGNMITAGVMGMVKRFRYLLITPSLLNLLDAEELKGVVAHEIGHIRKKHLLFYLAFFVGYVLLTVFSSQWLLGMLFRFPTLLDLLVSIKSYSEDLTTLLMVLPMALGLIVYFRFLFGYFMRNFERQADLFALKTIGSPDPLIQSLEKIGQASGQIRNLPSWHHFSIAQRVSILEQAGRQPVLIAKQDQKISRAVILFFLLLLGLSLYGVKEKIWLSTWPGEDPKALESLLDRELRSKPGETRTLLALAMLYHEGKRYSEAKETYEKILAKEPHHYLALNNLAWLLATSKDPTLFQPQKALALAKQAAALKSEAMILDTLAEAYLVNGQPDKALEIMGQVLSQNPANRSYYQGQEERFRKALEKKR